MPILVRQKRAASHADCERSHPRTTHWIRRARSCSDGEGNAAYGRVRCRHGRPLHTRGYRDSGRVTSQATPSATCPTIGGTIRRRVASLLVVIPLLGACSVGWTPTREMGNSYSPTPLHSCLFY